jgi:hypothetical protein
MLAATMFVNGGFDEPREEFRQDVAFLQKHADAIVLADPRALVAVVPITGLRDDRSADGDRIQFHGQPS